MNIDYKTLHDMLLKRKREIEEYLNYVEDYEITDELVAEIAEIDNMMISVRNMYKRTNGIPVRWKFGQEHPYKKLQKKRKR
jgi:HKD family nuclease